MVAPGRKTEGEGKGSDLREVQSVSSLTSATPHGRAHVSSLHFIEESTRIIITSVLV